MSGEPGDAKARDFSTVVDGPPRRIMKAWMRSHL
jgi:hypothetical protein